MKRLLVMLGVVVFLAALPLSHLAMAVPSCQEKVYICHVNSANDSLRIGCTTFTFGIVIEVDESAVPAHLEEHGDSLCFETFDEETRDFIEDFFGIRLPNADCVFPALLDGV